MADQTPERSGRERHEWFLADPSHRGKCSTCRYCPDVHWYAYGPEPPGPCPGPAEAQDEEPRKWVELNVHDSVEEDKINAAFNELAARVAALEQGLVTGNPPPGLFVPGETGYAQLDTGTTEPEERDCPSDQCLMCTGEVCNLCGAGSWSDRRDCDHDPVERHRPPDAGTTEPGPLDAFVTIDGTPTTPRAMGHLLERRTRELDSAHDHIATLEKRIERALAALETGVGQTLAGMWAVIQIADSILRGKDDA